MLYCKAPPPLTSLFLRRGLIGLLALLFSHAPKLLALYDGNPSAPMMPEEGLLFKKAWLSLKTGYTYDAVFSRSLKVQNHYPQGKIKKYNSHAQGGVLTIDCGDRVEFFSSLGSMSSSFTQQVKTGYAIQYNTDTHFAWSIGGRTLFAYWGDLRLGISASYLAFSPPIKSISTTPKVTPRAKADLDYREWQLGAGLSYNIKWLFPYIGALYSDVRAKFSPARSLHLVFPQGGFTLKNKKQLGLMIGCGLAAEKSIAANIEARFITEMALTASADIKF